MNLAAYASESNEQNFEVYWKTRIVDQRSRIGLKKLEIKSILDKSWIVTMSCGSHTVERGKFPEREDFASLEQYRYVKDFERFHTGVKLSQMCSLSLLAMFTFLVFIL